MSITKKTKQKVILVIDYILGKMRKTILVGLSTYFKIVRVIITTIANIACIYIIIILENDMVYYQLPSSRQ